MTPVSSTQRMLFRPFGEQLDDLRVDLDMLRPYAVTEVLARCTIPSADRDPLWDFPVGTRIEHLLQIAAMGSVEEFDAGLQCVSCGCAFEVTLTILELLAVARNAVRDVVEVAGSEGMLRFRRPTGRDQLDWIARGQKGESVTVAGMVASLALDPGEAPLPAIETALDEADPLLRSGVTAACPECGRVAEYETDPAGMALGHFRRAQEALFSQVHLLASRYHWNEPEIFELPAWRRKLYVSMLKRESL